jgi:hypothetical protein
MGELARFTVRGDESVVFEIDDSADGIKQVGLGGKGKIVDAQQAFEGKLAGIRDAAETALKVLKEDLYPDEVTLRFGIKMTVAAGAVVARTAVEGNMEVEMSWRRDDDAKDVARKSPQ